MRIKLSDDGAIAFLDGNNINRNTLNRKWLIVTPETALATRESLWVQFGDSQNFEDVNANILEPVRLSEESEGYKTIFPAEVVQKAGTWYMTLAVRVYATDGTTYSEQLTSEKVSFTINDSFPMDDGGFISNGTLENVWQDIQESVENAAGSASSAANSASQAAQSATDAEAAQAAAEAAEAGAESAQNAAEAAQTAAETAQGKAETAQSAAETAQGKAEAAQAAAEAAQTAAETAEGNAKTSETNAASSASAAAGSATSASGSASEAATSAQTAQSSASAAAGSATAAQNAQTAAETAETNAAGSASAAATSAGQAAQSATDASASASQADSARIAAESAKTAAQTAQSGAQTAETNAGTYAGNASGSASAAAQSATQAQAYMEQAKQYAQKEYQIYNSFDELPVPGDSAYIYLVPVSGGSGNDSYSEYLWITETSKYEFIGNLNDVDLSNYAQVNGTYPNMTVGNATNATNATNAANAENATSAASATKATQDGSGNNIASTYATKTELTEGLAGKQPTGNYALQTGTYAGMTVGNATNAENAEHATSADSATDAQAAAQADKLAAARTMQVNLASSNAAEFDGTENVTPGVTGILPVANGGTGASSLANVTVGNATNAQAATQAERDFDGNIIPDTYAKQSGTYPNMTVGNATKATQDGNGNNIVHTYPKIQTFLWDYGIYNEYLESGVSGDIFIYNCGGNTGIVVINIKISPALQPYTGKLIMLFDLLPNDIKCATGDGIQGVVTYRTEDAWMQPAILDVSSEGIYIRAQAHATQADEYIRGFCVYPTTKSIE